MTKAEKDNNGVSTIIGVSDSDGSTIVPIKINPSNHSVDTDDGDTGSDLSNDIANRDSNNIPVLMGVSSADGITPVAIYADPANGKLLVKST